MRWTKERLQEARALGSNWLTVRRMKELLDDLDDDQVLCGNDVHNILVSDINEDLFLVPVGYIDTGLGSDESERWNSFAEDGDGDAS